MTTPWGKLSGLGLICVLLVMLPATLAEATSPGQAPVISQRPADVTVGIGVPAGFAVRAFPSTGVTTQWFHENEALPGATNASLTIETAAFADAGRYSVIVSNEFGVVQSQSAHLRVVPAVRLEHLSTISTPRPPDGRAPKPFAMWVKAKENRAYIADRYIQIYDVTDPTAPVWQSTYGKFDSSIFSLFPFDHFVAATDEGYLLLLDVVDPANPVRLSRTRLLRPGLDVVVADRRAYVATTGGLEIYDLSDPAMPSLLGRYGSTGIYTVSVQNDFAYLGATSEGVLILDISNPAEPTSAGKVAGGWVDTVRPRGDLLYVAGDSLAIYDISDPRSPRALGSRRFLGQGFGSHGMEVLDGLVFTGQGAKDVFDVPALSVFDVGNPGDLAEVNHYKVGPSATVESVEIVDPVIYTTVAGKVEIFRRLPATNAPIVTAPIGDVRSVLGAPVRLQAGASGGEPVRWQWARDGAELPGETNRTLFLPAVTPELTGSYAVTAKNSAGSVTMAGSLALIEAPPLNLTIRNGPRLELQLPEGFQTRLEASSNLTTWTEIWSGQATGDRITPNDSPGNFSSRFYRLHFGTQ